MFDKLNIDFEADGERAVSPVIGVILMVAITVILAAVIGTFVLGLGDQVSSTTPQATINAETADDAPVIAASATENIINVNHRGGETLSASDTEVLLDGSTVWDGSQQTVTDGFQTGVNAQLESSPGDLSTTGTWVIEGVETTGAEQTISGTFTVTLIDTESSQIIAEKDVEL